MRSVWIVVGLTLCCLAGHVSMAQRLPPVIADLWGSDITVREFLERVDPTMLYRIPHEFWDVKVQWGAETLQFHWNGAPEEALTKDIDAGGVEPESIVIYVRCTNAIRDLGGRDVYYGASSTVWYPPFLRMPYMQVTAWLWETGMWPVDSEYDDCYNCWRVTVNDVEHVAGQHYYQTVSLHCAEAPPGYEPQYQCTTRYSSNIWID